MAVIEKEINQRKFKTEYQKAHINILFTASWLSHKSTRILKRFGISWQQFNVLRILRGMQPKPASVKILTERMIDKMSNASRLVDKLDRRGLVERKVCPEDRRRVDINITEKGLDLLAEASELMDREVEESLRNLSQAEAEKLNTLLDSIRS